MSILQRADSPLSLALRSDWKFELFVIRGIWDTHCGFKAFRREPAERIFSQTEIEGWGFDIEVLALARALNYKIGVISAHWINDDRSHMGSLDYVRALRDPIRVRTRLRRSGINH